MSRGRRLDTQGLEGLPLKLVIVAIVLGVSSPLIYGGLNAWEKAKLEGQLRAEAGAISDLAKLVYIGGPGNRQTLKVSMNGGVTAHADYLLIGDIEGGAYQCCIRYKVKGMPEQRYLVSDPSVPLTSPQGQGLRLMEVHVDLSLEYKEGANRSYVEVWTTG